MKKYVIAGIIWFCLLGTKIVSMSEAIPYSLYMDSNRDDVYEVKEEILSTYGELMRGVSNESDGMMIIHNLKQFEFDEMTSAKFKNNELEVIVGDGKGVYIHGELERKFLCVPEVKPKSLIMQYLK